MVILSSKYPLGTYVSVLYAFILMYLNNGEVKLSCSVLDMSRGMTGPSCLGSPHRMIEVSGVAKLNDSQISPSEDCPASSIKMWLKLRVLRR